MVKIVAANPNDDYLLIVRLDNGHSVTVNMKQKLRTARFSDLMDKQLFAAAETDGKAVHWPGGPSLAVNEIMEIVAK